MDVTDLVNYCKEKNQSFFINYLYLALRELNAIPEFCMRVHNGEPYQSMTLPVLTNPPGMSDQTYNIVPCVGWGKYVEENQSFKMSMHMKISHAFVDGKPLADAFNHIQAAINKLDFCK